MDLTFQVPRQHCCLQQWVLLSPPDTSTTEHCLRFGQATPFFLKLLVIALCSSQGLPWWVLFPGSRRSPGEGNGSPLQYSCLESFMDGGAWWVTVHGVAKNWTRLSDFTVHFLLLPSSTGHLPTWGSHFLVSYLFAFSYCSRASRGKETAAVCRFLLQGTTFCQNSPL